MSHIDEDTLRAFVQGELGDRVAAHVATHLDSCASCRARVAALDPWTFHFTSVQAPEIPDSLVEGALEAAAREATPAPGASTPLTLGAALTLLGASLGGYITLTQGGAAAWWSTARALRVLVTETPWEATLVALAIGGLGCVPLMLPPRSARQEAS